MLSGSLTNIPVIWPFFVCFCLLRSLNFLSNIWRQVSIMLYLNVISTPFQVLFPFQYLLHTYMPPFPLYATSKAKATAHFFKADCDICGKSPSPLRNRAHSYPTRWRGPTVVYIEIVHKKEISPPRAVVIALGPSPPWRGPPSSPACWLGQRDGHAHLPASFHP